MAGIIVCGPSLVPPEVQICSAAACHMPLILAMCTPVCNVRATTDNGKITSSNNQDAQGCQRLPIAPLNVRRPHSRIRALFKNCEGV